MARQLYTNNYSPAAPTSYLLHKWSRVIVDNVQEKSTSEEVQEAANLAFEATGLRCTALQFLFWPGSQVAQTCMKKAYAAILLALVAKHHDDDQKILHAELELHKLHPGLGNLISFCRVPADRVDWDYYDYLCTYPCVSLVADKTVQSLQISRADALGFCKTQSQKEALKRLLAIAEASIHFPKLAGISIPRAALIVAPSGTGKTWLVEIAARVLGLPVVANTVSGWSPRDARSDYNSMIKLIAKMENAPDGALIFIDEICKIRSDESDTGGNYWRAVQTEIMQLVTGDLVDYVVSDRAKAAISKSFFVFAGAFQSIYRKSLPDRDVTAEDVEALVITQEDLIEAQYLPDEMMNRTGAFISISPPTREEVTAAMMEIEIAAGVSIHEKIRSQAAEDIVARMQGFRGLENYAIRVAIQAVQIKRKNLGKQDGQGGANWAAGP